MGDTGAAGGVHLVGISLDCADPGELARFYVDLLQARLAWSHPHSAGIQVSGHGPGAGLGGVLLIAQRVEDYQPPAWPGTSIVHLDLTTEDPHAGEKRALALGGRPAVVQPDPRWRVLLDPAGHPFCLTTITPPPQLLTP